MDVLPFLINNQNKNIGHPYHFYGYLIENDNSKFSLMEDNNEI